MKIVALQVENIKKLIAVEIRPDGNMVQITGKNGAGKTSVLDSIWWALAGAGNVQAQPIRQGEEAARIRLDLGELIVTRKFTLNDAGETTSSLSVENAEGARFPSPQKMLDAMLGELTFDPLAFSRMDKKERFEVLKKHVDYDFVKLANLDHADRQIRTECNRKARDNRALAESVVLPEGCPTEPIDEAALLVELEKVEGHNKGVDEKATAKKSLTDKLANFRSGYEAQMARTQAEVEQLQKRINEVTLQRNTYADQSLNTIMKVEQDIATFGALPEKADPSPLIEKLKGAKVMNAMVAKRLKKAEYEREAEELARQSDALTAEIDARTVAAVAAIAAAKMPVKGIAITPEGNVLLNGVPFEQASDAEQLRASIEFAMAVNPKLKVIRVRDGSLLDDDAMKMLATMASTNDYQVWIERVDSSGKVGFVLEEGKLKEVVPE